MTGGRSLTINRILLRLILIRLFLPLLLITVVALGLGSYLVVRNETTRQLRLTRSLSHTVNSYLDQASRVLSTVAQVADQEDAAGLAAYMQTTWRGFGYFDALYALDNRGRIVQLVPENPQYQGLDMSRQFYFQATRGHQTIQISNPFMSPRTGQPTVYLALPLRDGGVVAGELNLGDLQQTVAAAYDADDRDTVFIADQVGTLLAHPQVALVAEQTNIGSRAISQRGLGEETTMIYTTSAGIVLGSATPVTKTNWVVIAEIPLQTAAGPIAGAVGLSFLISMIVWALIAWSLKRQLVRHVVTPLERLGRGADALAEGDFQRGEELVEHPGALAEIAALGTNLYLMSRSIQSRQTALKDSEVRLRLILEHMPVMLDALDEHDNIVFWNRECERVTGYSAAEIIDNPGALALIYPDQAVRETMFNEWRESEIVYRQREREVTTKDGHIRTVAWSTIAAHHPIPGWKIWSIGVDITERKRLEDQLRQSQKMQAIGQLAGGVAHDFNNLLTVILGYTDLALATMEPGDDWGETMEEIQKAASRAATLTHQLLAFSRRQILKPKVLDLNHAISEIKDMLSRLIGEDIDMVLELDRFLAPIRVDPGQIQQVIMNLVINARDAMPRGGILTVKTGNVELNRALPLSESELPPGAYVMLTVSDTGIGMSEETLSHIFEPFFTTKEKSKGTGLGLATTQGIVSQSGGHIEVASAPNAGSTFNVYFPRSAPDAVTPEERRQLDAAAQSPAARAAPAPPLDELERGATILLVEDEAMVRELAYRVLRDRGYRLFQASNSDSAVLLCATLGQPVDLLVTDVVMPGSMNGRELADRLRGIYPSLKVIYMSGYTDSTLLRQDVSSTEHIFLSKPFTPDNLLRKVREVLGKNALESEPHHAADL